MLKKKTRRLRASITKLITPYIYEGYKSYWETVIFNPRPMIRMAKDHFLGTNQIVGAEIGVAQGKNASSILQELPMKKLYLIDIYQSQYAKEILPASKTEWLVMRSDEAASKIHERLDFVYIDGDHSYECVKKDLELYYPLITPNGLIGGHDYIAQWSGVRKAAEEFTRKHDLRLHAFFPDFWIIKPARTRRQLKEDTSH